MTIKMAAALLGTATLAGSANAQNFLLSENSKRLAQGYLSCVNEEAVRLNGAGEPVSETVELAKTACERFETPIAIAIMQDVNTEMPKSGGEARLNVAQKLRESVYEQVTEAARLKLARVRSEIPNAKN